VHEVIRITGGLAEGTVKGVWSVFNKGGVEEPLIKTPPPPPPTMAKTSLLVALFGNTSPWVRLAGVSGAMAVGLGAYGAHGLKGVPDDQKIVWETANKYHFIHTLALLAVPLTNRPNLVGTLLVTGTALFSGTCYVHGATGNSEVIKYTPYGGMTLICAWIAMIL